MATVNQVFNQNLSADFNFGTDIPNKITANIDGVTLVRNPNGTLSAVTPTLTLATATKLVGFAGAYVLVTGSSTANPTLTLPYGFNIASVVAVGTTNDTRQFLVTFSSAHPNGADYIVTNSKASDEPNGDERKIQWKATSKTPTSFIMELTLDDNGATEDPTVFSTFDFEVLEAFTFVTNVTIA